MAEIEKTCENCRYEFEDMEGIHCRHCIHNAEERFEPKVIIPTEAEIRAKAIDEFAETLNKKISEFVLEHKDNLDFASDVLDMIEQLQDDLKDDVDDIVAELEKESDYEPIDYDYCDMSCSGEEHFISTHKAIEIVNELVEEYKGGWIPFTQRELTEEEKEEMGTDFDYILDCKLPENDTEILICSVNGLVFTDTFFNDGDGCYLDSGYDFIEDAIAWMPLPAPYKEGCE